jgi:predicted transcriptional regulator
MEYLLLQITALEFLNMSESESKLSLITSIAASYLRKNSIAADQIGNVISSITKAIRDASLELDGRGPSESASEGSPAPGAEKPAPAVAIRKSITREFLVCLDCGVHSRTLKRHLSTAHGLTPQQYRERWSLPRDYPMTAPAYSERRSEMAKQLGLGQKGRSAKSGAAKATPRAGGRKARS